MAVGLGNIQQQINIATTRLVELGSLNIADPVNEATSEALYRQLEPCIKALGPYRAAFKNVVATLNAGDDYDSLGNIEELNQAIKSFFRPQYANQFNLSLTPIEGTGGAIYQLRLTRNGDDLLPNATLKTSTPNIRAAQQQDLVRFSRNPQREQRHLTRTPQATRLAGNVYANQIGAGTHPALVYTPNQPAPLRANNFNISPMMVGASEESHGTISDQLSRYFNTNDYRVLTALFEISTTTDDGVVQTSLEILRTKNLNPNISFEHQTTAPNRDRTDVNACFSTNRREYFIIKQNS
ncbi:hypothetical protein SOPP22_13060 [Shewanella sp. OPT22]|nr:hypothetical protein SOPP22_13060 [Shewanella sp. OPT22]